MSADGLDRGPIPLYYQIAWQLRREIHARQYGPHARLPTEEELVRTFGVSRTTVRLAFQVLLKDGLVRRVAGRGTFVSADPGRHPVEWLVDPGVSPAPVG
jgi:GntR family transcriptional regulator